MSGSSTLPTDPFTDAERTDVRRFCGYPAYGSGASGFSSWRFFQAYGMLEYRLSNLAASEFQVVRQYLATLYGLEQAVPTAGTSMDTDQAAVWKRNRTEASDRALLFDGWCLRLCKFLGVPPGDGLTSENAIIV